ncbi:MAG: cobalt-precorrin-5B (C(1))-methyltransferase CbiD [Huintestinicola sp.]
MLEEYVYHGKTRLRCGYTTGSCAAAAAKAAVKMLLSGYAEKTVELMTPKGILLTLDVIDPVIDGEYASCAIKKDSGDDPDITNGILVYAKAECIPEGIAIDGGEGIGRVTRSGLDQPVGAAAINSVPRRMITAAAEEACEECDYHGGIKITVSVPDGVGIAEKTYNPRMGIVGGISIIGTSGIVEPMSTRALIDTIRTEIRMRKAENKSSLLLTIGNYSESFLSKEFPFMLENSVKCSNFIGEAIDSALEMNMSGILIIGHIGKLVKLGAGIMNTHSSEADGRMDVLVTCGVLAGVDAVLLKRLPGCVTVDEALAILEEKNMIQPVMAELMKKTQYYLNAKVKNEIPIGAVMFSGKYGILGMTEAAEQMICRISEEYNG